MKCKCGSEYNEITWHVIFSNGKRVAIGGNASNDKLDIAKAMKYTSYCLGAWNDKEITYKTYNHCFNCGFANNETITVI
jgi:hypothetical protein